MTDTTYRPTRYWDGEPGDHERVHYYGDDGPALVPRCEQCGRFVKLPKSVLFSDERGLSEEPHTTCKHCGPTRCLHVGWAGDFDD